MSEQLVSAKCVYTLESKLENTDITVLVIKLSCYIVYYVDNPLFFLLLSLIRRYPAYARLSILVLLIRLNHN